jgi:hypothetical protein
MVSSANTSQLVNKTFLSLPFSAHTASVADIEIDKYYTSVHFAVSSPDEVTGFFNWPDPSSCTMALGSTQPLTEMSTRNFPEGKGWPARKADNLTTIYELIV